MRLDHARTQEDNVLYIFILIVDISTHARAPHHRPQLLVRCAAQHSRWRAAQPSRQRSIRPLLSLTRPSPAAFVRLQRLLCCPRRHISSPAAHVFMYTIEPRLSADSLVHLDLHSRHTLIFVLLDLHHRIDFFVRDYAAQVSAQIRRRRALPCCTRCT